MTNSEWWELTKERSITFVTERMIIVSMYGESFATGYFRDSEPDIFNWIEEMEELHGDV